MLFCFVFVFYWNVSSIDMAQVSHQKKGWQCVLLLRYNRVKHKATWNWGEAVGRSVIIRARSQYWIMLGRLGFSLFQLKLSIIYTDNFCSVSLSYVERDNKKQKQNMFPFDFFVIDHFVANFDQKMLEKRDIKKNIFSMALGRTYA